MHYLAAQVQDGITGHTMFLLSKMLFDYPPTQIKIVLKHRSDLEKVSRQMPLLANATIVSKSKEYPLLNDNTTFYVCKEHTCLPPVNTLLDTTSFFQKISET